MQTTRVLGVFVLLMFAIPAQSALVLVAGGTTVDFYYDDADPGMVAYGALSVVGDSIFANPTVIKAESTNGGSDTYNSTGAIIVVAKPGYRFNAVAVAQLGDYQVSGDGADVTVSSSLKVADSTNAATNETSLMSVSGLGLNDGQLHEWSSFGQFDLSTATWDGITSIELSLDSSLGAETVDPGESALIYNKQTGGGLITVETVVPVPASIVLFISGFLGLAGVMRRNKNRNT